MLELYEPRGAFQALEGWLRERGFFAPGGEHLAADLYLGYGLSQSIRRRREPPSPEPCPLPLLACAVRAGRPHAAGRDGVRIGTWERTWTAAAHGAAVDGVRDAIARGDVYQVNLVQHLSAPFEGDPRALAPLLAPLRPLHGDPLAGDGWTVVSASPERFLARRGRRVWTNPIKGTRPLGEADDLAASPKDAAEHLMIVDLERN
ncbi:MAG TPA: chorismate-binding protein, partial [Gaiellaceae bacterium]|nr:chorismate-binding protein [Gaiellaceae bacterium]